MRSILFMIQYQRDNSSELVMFLTLVLLFVTFLVVVARFVRQRSKFWQCLREIPQPPGHPIIGNMLQYVGKPEEIFVRERKTNLTYYPICRTQILHLPSVSLMNPEDIELVLTDMKHITKASVYDFLHGWLGTGLLTSTDSKWKARRKILTPAFHFNILQEFVNIFNEETNKLVEDLHKECHKPFIDVLVPITQFTLMSIGETAMGMTLDVSTDEKNKYKNAVYKFGELLTYRLPRPWIHNDYIFELWPQGRQNKKVVKTLHTFTRNVIEKRKQNFDALSYSARKRLAMLDLLLKYRLEGANIDDEGIREEVDTFMFEGHDTTSMAITHMLMLLANHPETQNEIYKEIKEVVGNETPTYANLQELKFTERCIKEALRLYPSVPFIARMTGSDVKTTTGYTIPKDCMVAIQIYDLHHNPNIYPDPEKFDPDRFLPENTQKRHPFAYIPFSAGPRNCIGQRFAMLEIKAALCGILKRFILEAVDRPEDITFVMDMVLRPKGSVKVNFVPRF